MNPNIAFESRAKKEISQFLKVPLEKITPEAVLLHLVRESFVLVEMIMHLQDELGVVIIQDDLKGVTTVGQLLCVLVSKNEG